MWLCPCTFIHYSPFKALETKLIGGVTLNHLCWAALGGGYTLHEHNIALTSFVSLLHHSLIPRPLYPVWIGNSLHGNEAKLDRFNFQLSSLAVQVIQVGNGIILALMQLWNEQWLKERK